MLGEQLGQGEGRTGEEPVAPARVVAPVGVQMPGVAVVPGEPGAGAAVGEQPVESLGGGVGAGLGEHLVGDPPHGLPEFGGVGLPERPGRDVGGPLAVLHEQRGERVAGDAGGGADGVGEIDRPPGGPESLLDHGHGRQCNVFR